MKRDFMAKLIAHINRKDWWHVPPSDPKAYAKRGQFLASSFAEAEFYGRPLDTPAKVRVTNPLVGDEAAVSRVLGLPPQREDMELEGIAKHDSLWRKAALAKGYDAIVILSPSGFAGFKTDGKIPRSIELNVLNP